MANQKTERMDKAVRDEMMRLLRERVEDPTFERWYSYTDTPEVERSAGTILKNADLLTEFGLITLAGMDYHRRETANPVLTWLKANWFGAIVAGCTIGVSVWGIVNG